MKNFTFAFSIKDYLKDENSNNPSSNAPNPSTNINSHDKKDPPPPKQNNPYTQNPSSNYIPLQQVKSHSTSTYQDKPVQSSYKVTPAPTILKYFPSASHQESSMFESVEYDEKESVKAGKGKKATKKATKDPNEPKKPRAYTKKQKLEAENNLHNFGDSKSKDDDIEMAKKIEPIIEAPRMMTDLNPMGNSNVKKKCYEYADLGYWNNTRFPWSGKLLPAMDHYFGYRVFRSNQRAIVNATLNKRDVFVCMPTGGGKSLTFQLPAIVDKGVTIVVMPLLALIYDQVTQMEQKSISVLNLSGGAGAISAKEYQSLIQIYREQQVNMDNWNYTQAMPYPKIIFITPEKIVQSQITMNFLGELYKLGLLDRIVIDEAHCVSQWGRDFRKDYLHLKILRDQFPKVCMLALTATATDEIKNDVCQRLGMKNVVYFQNSFNRKNLIFEIRQKGKEAVKDVAAFIEEYYPRKCGIIFVSTKKDAEQVAQSLRQKHRIKAEFYHATMSEASRNEVQDKWMNDEIHVIVATIAFGMGINKLDVRYVIHFNFSKSISNYYQEAGRAGRDGQKAHCVIFYRYADKKTHDILNFHNHESNKEMKKENGWELMNVIKYCEDMFSCRRVMLLSYFGERFNKEECAKTCDNCRAGRIPLIKDFTEEAKIAINFLQTRENLDYTMNQLVQVLSDKLRDKNKTKFARETQIGLLKKMKQTEVEVLIKELVIKRFLTEIYKKHRSMVQDFLIILNVNRDRTRALFQGQEKVLVAFPSLKRMQSNVEEKETKEKVKNDKGETSTVQKSTVAVSQPPQRIYVRQKSEENTISKQVQNKAINLENYAFKKSSSPEDLTRDDKKKSVYTKEFGYCTSDQFDDIVDRLKIVRRQIFNQVKQNNASSLPNTSNPDAIIPIEGLYDLCRKLPTTVEELNPNNIKNIGSKQLNEHGTKFLGEIQHFINMYQINKNEFLFPKEVDEEENKEIFDIKDHMAPEPKDTMEAMNEWNFGIFEDETRLPSVSKSGNRTDVTDSDRGMNPEIDFNVRDFEEMNDDDWRHIDEDEDDFGEDDYEEKYNKPQKSFKEDKGQVRTNFEERKTEENVKTGNESDYDNDELDLIEEFLKQDKKESKQTETAPIVKPESVSRQQFAPVVREYVPPASVHNFAPIMSGNNNRETAFFGLPKSDENNNNNANTGQGTYISMRGNQGKRDRDSGDHFDAGNNQKKLKQLKFL